MQNVFNFPKRNNLSPLKKPQDKEELTPFKKGGIMISRNNSFLSLCSTFILNPLDYKTQIKRESLWWTQLFDLRRAFVAGKDQESTQRILALESLKVNKD